MGKYADKLFIAVLAIATIAAFRDTIVMDDGLRGAFDAIMEELPFAKIISDFICTLVGFKTNITETYPTPVAVLFDTIKLTVMSILTPIFMAIVTPILLPMPNAHWRVQEAYLESPGHKLKEIIVRMAVTVPLAFIVSKLLSDASEWILASFGTVVAWVLGGAGLLVFSSASVIALSQMAGISLGTAVLWRLAVTLGPQIITELLTVFMCLAAYLALVNGVPGVLFSSIAGYIICLLILDYALSQLMRILVE